MREGNLSHECYLNDPKYDNLPNYIYHDIHITLKDKKGKIRRNADGTPMKEHHRFAQEMITDEQINIELKEIFDKIKNDMNANITIIKAQKYLTEDQCKEKINNEKSKIDKKIKEINDNIDLSDKAKTKQTTDQKSKLMDIQKNIEKKEIEISDDDQEYFIKIEEEKTKKKINDEKAKKYNIIDGKTVRYGIIPEILTELLNKRKDTNYKLSQEKDPSKKPILNGAQIAYKLVANSVYGQTGAPTSPIYFIAIAASTTAIGRERLHYAKKMVEENFPESEVIYGDTDSIFINFHLRDADGNERTDKQALIETIDLAQKAAKLINDNVPKPQGIVYEKTMHPFILAAKKKYVGLLFEKDPNKYFLKPMGIVLKRRDNAPIVKIVVGGIIDHLLKNRDIDKAVEYTREVLRKLMDGQYPIDKFLISKTLKAKYKKPSTIAHKVLADRMAQRDPGNKPQINDRIPFVYIVKDLGRKKQKDILQGELIEHPEYVVKNNLKIDYLYYLEHQIIIPASQILELMMPKKKVDKLFIEFIIEEENKRKGRQSMEKWMDYTKIKSSGSKTAKNPTQSLKDTKRSPKRENKYENLPKVGNTRRHECQSMSKWLHNAKATINSDDWNPEFD